MSAKVSLKTMMAFLVFSSLSFYVGLMVGMQSSCQNSVGGAGLGGTSPVCDCPGQPKKGKE